LLKSFVGFLNTLLRTGFERYEILPAVDAVLGIAALEDPPERPVPLGDDELDAVVDGDVALVAEDDAEEDDAEGEEDAEGEDDAEGEEDDDAEGEEEDDAEGEVELDADGELEDDDGELEDDDGELEPDDDGELEPELLEDEDVVVVDVLVVVTLGAEYTTKLLIQLYAYDD